MSVFFAWQQSLAKRFCKNVKVRIAMMAGIILCLAIIVGHAPAQEVANRAQPILTTLFPPVYPPLARMARVTGEVKINLLIKKDGSIESAMVASGHPLLNQAVLDSINKSKFECKECVEDDDPYTLTYIFKIVEITTNQCDSTSTVPQVSQLEDQVLIVAGPECLAPSPCEVDWVTAHSKFRSAKCLYLWKCGTHHIGLQ